MTMRRIWTVVPFTLADLPALGLYFKRHLSAASQYGSMAVFHWRSVDNYLMPGIINLIKDDEKIVATLSNTPKSLLVHGKACLVAEIGDANTDPEYQRQGMLTLLTNQSTQDALDRGILGVYSTPSTVTPSLPAFIGKCGFLPQQEVQIRNLVLPLDIGPLVGKVSHWLIGRYASALYLTLVQVFYWFKHVRTLRMASSLRVEEVATLPEDWDPFWVKASQSYDMVFERDRQALAWRFFRNPNKYQFFVARHDGAIVGYLVYRVVSDDDQRRVVLADFLFLPGFEFGFKVILMRVFKEALRLGANSMSSWCLEDSGYDRALKSFGFRARGAIVLVWFQNAFATGLTGRWHFTISDSDNV